MQEIMGRRSDKVTKSYNKYKDIDLITDADLAENMMSLVEIENSFDRT